MTQADPYAGLQSNFAMQLHQLVQAVQAQGGNIGYESGHRETGQPGDGAKGLSTQYGLYERAVAKYGKAQAANWAAVPGTSNHEKGLAMDINGDQKSIALAHKLAPQFGLAFPLANEAWHVQLASATSHDNQGGPQATAPLGQVDANGVEQPQDNTPEARVGSVISFLTGGKSNTSGVSDMLPMVGDSTLQTQAPTADPTNQAANSPSIPGGMGSGNLNSISGSTAYDAQFQAAAAKYGISASLLKAVAKQESGFNPKAGSSVGAQGLMQFMPGTAKGLGIDPWDPNQAIDGAAKMLSGLIKQFGSPQLALAAYNAGAGAVQKYKGIPPFKETQNYVKSIMSMVGGN